MPKSWYLTQAAQASLIEIAKWTVESFGPRQASAYEEDLIAAASGEPTVPTQDYPHTLTSTAQ